MNAIHIIMATSTSANPHNAPNERIENIIRKRKMSAITFLIFGILLIIAGSLLVSFESQRFSISFITFGTIGILFAFVYWISAEQMLITLRRYNTSRIRTANIAIYDLETLNNENFHQYTDSMVSIPPTYEQSITPHLEIPPSYDEATKMKCSNDEQQTSIPSFSIDQNNSRINNK